MGCITFQGKLIISSWCIYINVFCTKTANRAENKIFHIQILLNTEWHLQLQGLNFICMYSYITLASFLECAWTSIFNNYCGIPLEDESDCGLMACSEHVVVSEFSPLETTWCSCVKFGSRLVCLGIFMQRKTEHSLSLLIFTWYHIFPVK